VLDAVATQFGAHVVDGDRQDIESLVILLGARGLRRESEQRAERSAERSEFDPWGSRRDDS
jgi:hypothetical protein